MEKSVLGWQVKSFGISTLAGTLLHFLYDWTNGSILVAPFSGVNESTWEHMKLLFWPMLLMALVQRKYFKSYENYWCTKLAGIIAGLVLIPVLFYTYNGAFGKSPDWINITIFFVAAALAYGLETLLFQKANLLCGTSSICLGVIWLLGALFIIFTFIPPHIPLFRDPISGSYGL